MGAPDKRRARSDAPTHNAGSAVCPCRAEEFVVATMRWKPCGHSNGEFMHGDSLKEFPDIPFSESRQAQFG